MTAVPSTQTTFSYLGDKDGKQDPDYYAILNSHETSTMDQIAEEYKVLARRYHPDRSDNPADAEKFTRIGEAYRVLGDHLERQKYDRYRASGLNITFEQWKNTSAHQRVMHWYARSRRVVLSQPWAHSQ